MTNVTNYAVKYVYEALTSCGQVAALHDDSTLRARVKNDDETGLRAPGSRYLVTVTQSAVVSTRFSSCISRADSFQRFTALSTTGDNSDSQLSTTGDNSDSQLCQQQATTVTHSSVNNSRQQ